MGTGVYGGSVGRAQVNANGSAAKSLDPADAISAQMERISCELREMSKLVLERRSDSAENFGHTSLVTRSNELAALVQSTIQARLARAKHFPPNIFADPAWDILLDLFQAHLLQHRITVTDLGSTSQVPQTTALRWITNLIDVGLIARRSDPLDGRRTFVELTNAGRESLYSYFEAIRAKSNYEAN